MYGMIILAAISHFTGKAVDDHGNFLFSEKCSVEREGAQIISIQTEYEDSKGSRLASLASHFGEDRHFPNLSYILRTKESTFNPRSSGVIAGHGIYIYLVDNLSDLLNGKEKVVTILSAEDGKEYPFLIKGKRAPNREDVAIATIVLKNPLLRPLVHPMEFHIEEKTGKLLAYHGIDGYARVISRKKRIHIEYTHED